MRGDVNTEFAKLRGDMTITSAVTDAKFAAVDAKLAAVDLKLAGMADQIGKIDSKLDKLLAIDCDAYAYAYESARNRK